MSTVIQTPRGLDNAPFSLSKGRLDRRESTVTQTPRGLDNAPFPRGLGNAPFSLSKGLGRHERSVIQPTPPLKGGVWITLSPARAE